MKKPSVIITVQWIKDEQKCINTCLNEVVSAPLYRFSSVLKSLVDRQQDAARNTNSPVTSQHDLMRYVTQTRIGHVTETVRGSLSVSQSGACVYLHTAAKDKCLMNYRKLTRYKKWINVPHAVDSTTLISYIGPILFVRLRGILHLFNGSLQTYC